MSGFTYGEASGATYGDSSGGTWSVAIDRSAARGHAGFTYGGATGASYGEASGGVWSPGSEHWTVGGAFITGLTEERRDWQDLSLTWQVDEATLEADLSPLQVTAEKFETILKADGSFSSLDRSASGGTVTLEPPVDRDPPRQARDYLVAAFSQQPLDRNVGEFNVDVELRALENREPDGNTPDEQAFQDDWRFVFRSAAIATKRVSTEILQGTESNADRVQLTLILDPTQMKALEESLTRLAAASIREVPDGSNTADDDSASPADANTVTVTTPDGQDPIREGDWVALQWQSEWISAEAYRVQLVLGDPT